VKEINSYWRQLTPEEIVAGKHRDMVGGLWDEIGRLQFEFLKKRGLLPEHTLLDVGCGSLRGGVHFVQYLHDERYCGLDINASLIEAGKVELAAGRLLDKRPQLLVNDGFEFSRFAIQFDFALAISVFTHLFMNHISRCLVEIRKVLKPNGKFYATFFQAPHSICLSPILHEPGSVTTFYDSDPFHYSHDELKMLAANAGLLVELIGDWEHPRSQKMVCYSHLRAA
jgi:SAM-dependent methyltransferase